MTYQLSDNGLEAVKEIGRWIMAAIAVGALWVQSHNQHADDMKAKAENRKQLSAIEVSLQKMPRPVYAKEASE